MGSKPEQKKQNKCFDGWVRQYTHDSEACGCKMTFTVYYPPAAEKSKVPVVYWLSGLTCTDENFQQKAGAQRRASQLGLALVSPDTSPRGLNVPGEDDAYDFGTGAGFYLNATEPQWQQYRMYDYVVKELPQALRQLPGLDVDKASIMGHSMGGHGALVLGLRNPDTYAAISAFAPIVNPSSIPWGQKAFKGYLGDKDTAAWKEYDATELAKKYSGPPKEVLVDQGTADDYLGENLQPEKFAEAANSNDKLHLTLRMQEGYDHSYYTIATFIDDHLQLHAKALQAH